jgi:hypothetical protein
VAMTFKIGEANTLNFRFETLESAHVQMNMLLFSLKICNLVSISDTSLTGSCSISK